MVYICFGYQAYTEAHPFHTNAELDVFGKAVERQILVFSRIPLLKYPC